MKIFTNAGNASLKENLIGLRLKLIILFNIFAKSINGSEICTAPIIIISYWEVKTLWNQSIPLMLATFENHKGHELLFDSIVNAFINNQVTIYLKTSIITFIPKEVCMNNKWTWVIAAIIVIVILYFVFS